MKHLTDQDIAVIKARILRGDRYLDIVMEYRLNQGRISDLRYGRLRPHIRPAAL